MLILLTWNNNDWLPLQLELAYVPFTLQVFHDVKPVYCKIHSCMLIYLTILLLPLHVSLPTVCLQPVRSQVF